jgi:general secretion pathway protein B
MSYILDALKKAESERRLGTVPSVHAQPISITSFHDVSSPWRKPWIWLALAILLGCAGILIWFQPWQHAFDSTTVGAAGPAVVAPLQNTVNGDVKRRSEQEVGTEAPIVEGASDTQVPATVAQGSPAKTDSAIISAQPAPAVLPHAKTNKPSKAAAEEPRTLRPNSKPTKQSGQSGDGGSVPSAASPELKAVKKQKVVPASVPAEKRVAALRELPENIQREIPALVVGGFIYSNRPAERSVLINNKLLHEGDEVTPGITLEKMLPKEAVLNYKGYRYRIPY